MATLLRCEKFQGGWNIRKNSAQARDDLRELRSIVTEFIAELLQARSLGQSALNNLDEGQIRERLISLIAAAYEIGETLGSGMLGHLQCQAGLAYAWFASQHNDRTATRPRAIDSRANHIEFGYSPDKCGSFRKREWRSP